jgi:dihydrofolate reductase
MGKLIYGAITSLDHYIADATGDFQWAAPDEQVHAFVNELERPVGTYLYGRRMYEVMAVWDDMAFPDPTPATRDFGALWQAADKIVFSTTLDAVTTRRTRLERSFDVASVRRLKEQTEHDITVGGPHLAAHAIAAGLVDEYQLFLTPIVVGGGIRSLPDDVRVDLELLDERRFTSGVVFLRYGVVSGRSKA